MIPSGFDESNQERRKRLFKSRMKTSDKLAERIIHFFGEVDFNMSLSKTQKETIKNNLINKL